MIEQIWSKFHQQLLNFIKSRVNNQAIAEDILQDVFIQVIKRIDGLEDKKKLPAWLYQICRNKIIDYYRIKKNNTISIHELENIAEHHAFEDYDQLHNCLRMLISDLPANVSSILIASDLDNIKQKDIARDNKISLSAIKSRIRRGRALLKEKIRACCFIEFTATGPDATCGSKCGCKA